MAGGVAGALVATIGSAAAYAAAAADPGIQIKIASSGKCLNVAGASTADKAKIVQYGCVSTAPNDKFVIVPQGGDAYWIKSVGSGKCLNVSGNSTANLAPIIQYTCSSAPNNLWKVDLVQDKPTIRFISKSSGRCLNVSGGTTADNAPLVQYGCTPYTTTLNEQFYLPPTASQAAVHRPFTAKQPISVLQGAVPAGGGVAPVYYSYISATNQLTIITDRNPDPNNTDPNAPDPVVVSSFNFGYTGRTYAAPLADGRVEVAVHDAAAGDVVLADETTKGTGLFSEIPDIGGTMAAQPTVGPVAQDRLAAYGIIDGALWYAPESKNNPQMPYGAWRSLGGTGLTGTPVSVRTAQGVRIFALNTSGHLLTATLTDGTTLSAWSDLGGDGLAGTVSAVAGTDGRVSLFVQSGDGTIVTKKQNADQTFPDAWTPIGDFKSGGSPSAVLDVTPGRIAVASRGTDNELYLAYETAAGSGQYSDWFPISPGTATASDPTAFSYDVPSGASFGVAFQSTDSSDVPYVFLFDSASAKSAVPHAKVHKLSKPAKKIQLTH